MLLFLASFQLAFSISPATWISDSLAYIGDKSLKNLTLPGTHDSGTYYLTDVPMPGDTSGLNEFLFKVAVDLDVSFGEVAISWGRSQDQNFYQQMQGGIRYFDLRSGWDKAKNEWVTFHFVIGSPVQYLLQNISQYLNDYPKEIVIVEMTHFEGYPTSADVTALKNMVVDILGKYMYPVDLTFGFTVNSMVNSGKRALVTMEQGADGVSIWPPGAIYNTYADSPNLEEMMAYNNRTVAKYMNGTWPQQLFKVSWTLTPNATSILDTVIPWKPHSLIELANTADKALPSFWIKIKKLGWKMGNILIIDHYEYSDIVKIIWESNGIPYQDEIRTEVE